MVLSDAQSAARAAELRKVLNTLQRAAYLKICSGGDFCYLVNGGPGCGKSVVLGRCALTLEQTGVHYQIIAAQRAVSNIYAKLGLQSTSTAAWLHEPELVESSMPNRQFVRSITRKKAKGRFVLFIDEYGYMSLEVLKKLINCSKMISQAYQIVCFGDVGQLEKPNSVGLPAIVHPMFRDRSKTRVLMLLDASNRFLDKDLAHVIRELRDVSKPIDSKAETLLINLSHTCSMWAKRTPQMTLCITNRAKDVLNKRQWQHAEDNQRVCVEPRAGRKVTNVPRPNPVYLTYGSRIMFYVPYWPHKDEEMQDPIANGEMGTLVSGPTGTVTASTDTTFVVDVDGRGSRCIACKRSNCGDYSGYVISPIIATAGVTFSKFQGQTLDDITVDMRGCGRVEALVALSRGRRFDQFDGRGGLRISHYEPGSAENCDRMTPSVKASVIAFAALEARTAQASS